MWYFTLCAIARAGSISPVTLCFRSRSGIVYTFATDCPVIFSPRLTSSCSQLSCCYSRDDMRRKLEREWSECVDSWMEISHSLC
ncbi:hypothetical protein BS47DRAFT_1343581 [Hydnum rufescens UP504]|uniref:Uncharacterized protein n=1 Tax=Hydnum rufescens UP504 TaxID=1448309 RepID=A0A9P6AZ78_9AGAM|nr:hypothetical protein BS47DRAFT_1343581 [Hydnum rufescens UP504]